METIKNQLDFWLSSMQARRLVSWEQLPDIGLYMDQVLTYVDRQLGLYRGSEKEHILTPAMINNYIKDELLPRAEVKKYAPSHLALLTMIGALKQVLSMQDLQNLLAGPKDSERVQERYERFLKDQNDVVNETSEHVRNQVQAIDESADDGNALRDLALDLAIEARVRILISEHILTLLTSYQQSEKAKKAASDSTDLKTKKAKPIEKSDRQD
jgi:hypothetical protein